LPEAQLAESAGQGLTGANPRLHDDTSVASNFS
jgi:hypothetical protein